MNWWIIEDEEGNDRHIPECSVVAIELKAPGQALFHLPAGRVMVANDVMYVEGTAATAHSVEAWVDNEDDDQDPEKVNGK